MAKYLVQGHTRMLTNREFKKVALNYFGKNVVSQIWLFREKFYVLATIFNKHPMTFIFNRLSENLEIRNGHKECPRNGEVLYQSYK